MRPAGEAAYLPLNRRRPAEPATDVKTKGVKIQAVLVPAAGSGKAPTYPDKGRQFA